MKKINDKNFWLKDITVKKSVSDKKVVSKMIVEIGSKILEDMYKEKFSKMIK
jgi:hypothetical protein